MRCVSMQLIRQIAPGAYPSEHHQFIIHAKFGSTPKQDAWAADPYQHTLPWCVVPLKHGVAAAEVLLQLISLTTRLPSSSGLDEADELVAEHMVESRDGCTPG